MGQLCDFMSAVVLERGNYSFNGEFGEHWRTRWQDGGSAGLTPNSVYVLGDVDYDDAGRHRAPYAVDILDCGHKAFSPDENGMDMLETALLCLQGDVEPQNLRITAYAPTPSRFAALHNLDPELFGRAPSVEKLLADAKAEIDRIHAEVLRGRYDSLYEMAQLDDAVQQAGHRPEPWRVVVLVGDGTSLDAKSQALLDYVAQHGRAAGISLLTQGIPLPAGIADFEYVGNAAGMPETGHIIPRQPPTSQLVAAVARLATEHFRRPPASPDFLLLMPDQLFTERAIDGLEWVAGVADGQVVTCRLDDDTPHAFIGGRSGLGKTSFLLGATLNRAMRYGPNELTEIFIDLKDSGVDGALLAGENALPHLGGVFMNIKDYEVVVDLLERLEEERERRSELFISVGAKDYREYRQITAGRPDAEPLPRISLTVDELQMALKSHVGGVLLDLLDRHSRLSRSVGIHLTIGSQQLPPETEIPRAKSSLKGMLNQFGLRLALTGAHGVLDSENTAADKLVKGQMVLNDQAGARHGNRVVQFVYAGTPQAQTAKNRVRSHMTDIGRESPQVSVHNGGIKPRLEDDQTYQTLGPSKGIRQPQALIGKETTVAGAGATVEFRNLPGRNLVIFGGKPEEVCTVVDTVTASLAKQHPTRSGTQQATFRVVCANDDPSTVERVDNLCGRLEAMGARYMPYTSDQADVAIDEVTQAVTTRHGGERSNAKEYLIVVGADSLGKAQYTGSKLARIMAEGPTVGVHTIATAGTPRQLRTAMEDKSKNAPMLASLTEAWVTTADVPQGDVPPISGEPPKLATAAGRVHLYDARTVGTHRGPRKLRLYAA